ncbi:MAG: hypothetical protein PUF12_02835 [Thermoflexaceae bacterium]|nr:hypothetical protein [Thermoflexaceae bacterium]
MDINIGTFAKSKAGHDVNQIYVIINCDEEYVYLADGRVKLIEKPKKKKRKHIQKIGYMDPVIGEKLKNNNLLKNEDIKKAIKDYKAEN